LSARLRENVGVRVGTASTTDRSRRIGAADHRLSKRGASIFPSSQGHHSVATFLCRLGAWALAGSGPLTGRISSVRVDRHSARRL